MRVNRSLIVVADDLGIGPETTRGIIELAEAGIVTGAVLLVNSPYAVEAVKAWRSTDVQADLGWHPCLTMDAPVAPASQVASLIGHDGRFHPLPRFLRKLSCGMIRSEHIQRELSVQYVRFRELTGRTPCLVNAHQHVALFGPVGRILRDVLRRQTPRPYLRRVTEPMGTLLRIRGSRVKRFGLTLMGGRQARIQAAEGFPGAGALLGITDPPHVRQGNLFASWLRRTPGRTVEMMCHPGRLDATLVGRDCAPTDGYLQRRVDEWNMLRHPAFLEACREAGFHRMRPSDLIHSTQRRVFHVA